MLNILISILIVTLPFEILQFSIAGLDIRIHQIILGLIILVLIPQFFKQNPITTIWRNIISINWYYNNIHLVLWSLIWVATLIGGILNGGDLQTTIIRNIVLLGYIIVFYTIYRYLNTRERLYKTFNLVFISTGILILIGLYEAIAFQLGWNSFQVFPGRVDALLPEPNWFGMWLAIVYAIALPLAFMAKGFKQQFLLWFLLLGIILMSILSVTRASWVAIIFITGIYLIYQVIFVRKYIQLLNFAIVLFAVSFGAAGMSQLGLTDFNLKDRLTSIISQNTTYYYEIDEQSGEQKEVTDIKKVENKDNIIVDQQADVNVISRRDGYINAGVIIYRNIFTGVGLAGYENIVGDGYNTNNILLAIAVAGGIFAITLFLSFLYIITKQGFLIIKNESTLASILFGSMLAVLITGMFNDNLLMGFIWLIFGIISAIPEVVWAEQDNKNKR
ncbi:MAG: O-antigen ligase family protein [Minisyncoccia bacterium]